MSWQDDPTERDWERRVDRATAARSHDDDMQQLRDSSDLRVLGSKIDAARSSMERTRRSEQIDEELASVEATMRAGKHFNEATRERWVRRMRRVARAEGDDLVEAQELLDDFVAAASGLRVQLREIADTIADDPGRPAGVDGQNAPVLVRLREASTAARSTVELVRSRLERCHELAPATRQSWLNAVPDPEDSLWWLQNEQARTSGTGLRAQVEREVEYVERFTTRVVGDLRVVQTLVAARGTG